MQKTWDDASRPIVVCVDDEPRVLSALARVLRAAPIELRATTDPDQALDWVRTEEVALLISDYRMPRMSGTTVLQLAKAAAPGTKRLMLTGYPDEGMVVLAGAEGLMDVAAKPWGDEALRRAVLDRVTPNSA
jgi:DNA-binding NtrC family response regulator